MKRILIAALLLAFPAAAEPRLDRHPAFASKHVEPRDVTVFVPDECQGTTRCAVLYMLDGQNLYTPSQYSGADWGVRDTVPKLIKDGRIPPTIVVGIDNVKERTREYMPERVYRLLPKDYQARVRAFEDGKAPNSDNFLKFVVTELKPFVDAKYQTLTGPAHTAIMGSSMGGHVALYAHGEYPSVFGSSASLSMPWLMASWATDEAHIKADAAVLRTAWSMWLKTSKLKPVKNRIYTDQGTLELDARFTPYEAAITPIFPAAGWVGGRDFKAEIFENTKHSETDWRQRLDIPLTFMLKR
ncbi:MULTISPECIES: alpha/beta hydrolase [Asticcacaulis]|uniref:alpha/beta hydrolase n=1 Tax=Asticcacaulis TaxID=76890 RepID=UPI001AE6455D|nr:MULTISPECIES: alpha/beta hydrolase-fold protein [Asticcacaulis]MBP2160004.1 putative alpha/beta superfamily hydrolase [Asticcacaulis solisilvae]MDR6801049.1 putative alpha/beta superfamily hydrolase [Asticcacaulis sp. BE141]